MNKIKYFSGKALASIILSVISVVSADIGCIFNNLEEIVFSVIITLLLLSTAFALQFAARKEKIFVVWKIISYISLGFCIYCFLILTIMIYSAIKNL